MVFYINKKTKLELEEMKFEIWKKTEKNIPLTKLFREAIGHMLRKHRLERINKYLVNSNDRN